MSMINDRVSSLKPYISCRILIFSFFRQTVRAKLRRTYCLSCGMIFMLR